MVEAKRWELRTANEKLSTNTESYKRNQQTDNAIVNSNGHDEHDRTLPFVSDFDGEWFD